MEPGQCNFKNKPFCFNIWPLFYFSALCIAAAAFKFFNLSFMVLSTSDIKCHRNLKQRPITGLGLIGLSLLSFCEIFCTNYNLNYVMHVSIVAFKSGLHCLERLLIKPDLKSHLFPQVHFEQTHALKGHLNWSFVYADFVCRPFTLSVLRTVFEVITRCTFTHCFTG